MESMIIGIMISISSLLFSPARSNHHRSNSIAGRFCSQTVHSPPQSLAENFLSAMNSVSSQINRTQWGMFNVTKPSLEIDVFAQCFGEMKAEECSNCFGWARSAIQACLPSVSGEVYMESCFLRYSGGSSGKVAGADGGAAAVEGVSGEARVKCGGSWGCEPGGEFMRDQFALKVKYVMSRLVSTATTAGTGFGVVPDRGGVQDIYALGQCWNVVGGTGCERCLNAAGARLFADCARPGASSGRAMLADCYVRYSTDKFFGLDPDREDEESIRGWIIVAGILSSVVLALLAVFGVYLCYKKVSINRGGETPIHGHNFRLHFKYETLEKATDYFHSTRKLGQGGSGSVFKGILSDGRIVAVKRLFFSTRQWVDEFFNEVNLINGINHKNLVKLLGCSIEGPESLLVYEFVPNRSLDQVIFDRKGTVSSLIWQQRFDIILGIAEGLAYLHGGCGVRIIHRDIKASNVLLGDNLVPKIADFGLARSVAQDKSHLSTGIAGTLGYMAPEYLVRGQLTEKADLYAFGVLVLEIVCGRRNSTFTLGSSSILHKVWKLHKENRITDSVDTSLKGNFNHREASNVLQIGLLCTQASVVLRPSMTEVIEMLCDNEREIPTPKQPPFLNSSLITSDATNSTSSFQNPSEISCSFTANSSTIYESLCYSGVGSNSFNAKHFVI